MSLAIIKDEMRNVRTLALANGSAVVANQIVLQNAIVLVALLAAGAGVEIGYMYFGKVGFPKATGVSFAPGDDCYWDNNASNITTTPAGNTLCGICLLQNQNADTEIVMMLYPYAVFGTDAVAQSKATSAAALVSTAESQAVSVATTESTNKSIADSKAASLATQVSSGNSAALSEAASVATQVSSGNSAALSEAASVVAQDSAGNSANASAAASAAASLAAQVSAAISTALVASAAMSKLDSAAKSATWSGF
jgi:predicted RecA/RadA family phage recombinase